LLLNKYYIITFIIMLHGGVGGGNLPAGGQKTKFRPNIWKIRTPPVKYVEQKVTGSASPAHARRVRLWSLS